MGSKSKPNIEHSCNNINVNWLWKLQDSLLQAWHESCHGSFAAVPVAYHLHLPKFSLTCVDLPQFLNYCRRAYRVLRTYWTEHWRENNNRNYGITVAIVCKRTTSYSVNSLECLDFLKKADLPYMVTWLDSAAGKRLARVGKCDESKDFCL